MTKSNVIYSSLVRARDILAVRGLPLEAACAKAAMIVEREMIARPLGTPIIDPKTFRSRILEAARMLRVEPCLKKQ